MKIVVSGNNIPDPIRNLVEENVEIVLLRGEEGDVELRTAIADADYYFFGGDEFLNENVISAASKLKAISLMGAGAASFIDLEAAQKRKIDVFTTPGANAIAVAEYAVGQAIGIHRNIFSNLVDTERGKARDSVELTAAQIGIVGLGAVGTEVARILRYGFECDVSYNSRHRKTEAERTLGVHYRHLNELFTECSTIFVCCELNADTTALLGEKLLTSGVNFVVCIADPRVFILSDLAKALASGALSSVALDGDYMSIDSLDESTKRALDSLRNVSLFVTSHIAASSQASWSRMQHAAVDNLLSAIDD